MASKETAKNVVDLQDYVCKAPNGDDLRERMRELKTSLAVGMPCGKLGWCPYGRLASAFPSSGVQAQRRGLSQQRHPVTCHDTGSHCPAFYLADRSMCDPFAHCFGLDGEKDCVDCPASAAECRMMMAGRRLERIAEDVRDLQAQVPVG